jgi:hypothetical protein
MSRRFPGVRVATVFLVAVTLLAPVRTDAQAPADRWTFSVMPYLWLPGMEGTLHYGAPAGGVSPVVSIDAGTLLSDLDMAFLISGEARKGRWLIATDVAYLDLGSNTSKVKSVDFNPGAGPVNAFNTALDAGTQTKVKSGIWTLVGGYAAVEDPRVTVDVFGGFRYFGMKATTNWQLSAAVSGPGGTQTFPAAGSVTESEDIWDAIVGVKGRIRFGESHWFLPYYLDAGAGDSVFTWQGMLGVGHAFKWGDIIFAYRQLSYDQAGKLVEDLNIRGFGLGLNFRF